MVYTPFLFAFLWVLRFFFAFLSDFFEVLIV